MIQFNLFGIPVKILPWFWVTMALIGGVLGADDRDAVFRLLLFLLAGFVSILVHEFGHGLTAKAFGKHVEIVLQAFGGYAAYSGGAPLSRPRTFLITAAGPAIQILLGLGIYALSVIWDGAAPHAEYFLYILYSISFIWAILNLLPVLPLDGGRLMQTLLGPNRIRLTLIISITVAVAAGLLAYMKTGSFLMILFMGMFAWQSFQALQTLPSR